LDVDNGEFFMIVGVVELSDGRFLTHSMDCTIRIWSGKSSDCQLLLKGHTSSVICVTELPNMRILSESVAGEMILWNSNSGDVIEKTNPNWLRQKYLPNKWIDYLSNVTHLPSLWLKAPSRDRQFLLGIYEGKIFRWYTSATLRTPICQNGHLLVGISNFLFFRIGLSVGRNRIRLDDQ
jgi:WD40 repeat protein